jgi:hypothetical protein
MRNGLVGLVQIEYCGIEMFQGGRLATSALWRPPRNN